MTSTDRDTAGVVAPPPIGYLVAVLIGWLLERVVRWRLPVGEWGRSAAVVVTIAAVVLIALALIALYRARTPPEPYKPTRAIVSRVPYSFSRNPIYVGFTLLHVGIALWLASGWILLMLVPATIFIRYGVIAREERYLERKFGEEYTRYRSRVRRWG